MKLVGKWSTIQLQIRIFNQLLVAFDEGWICLGAEAKTEASQQTATLANMTESGYTQNKHRKIQSSVQFLIILFLFSEAAK